MVPASLSMPVRTEQIRFESISKGESKQAITKGVGLYCKTRWMKGNTNPLVSTNKEIHNPIFRKIWGKATNLPSHPSICLRWTNPPLLSWGSFVNVFKPQMKIMLQVLCEFYAVIQLNVRLLNILQNSTVVCQIIFATFYAQYKLHPLLSWTPCTTAGKHNGCWDKE